MGCLREGEERISIWRKTALSLGRKAALSLALSHKWERGRTCLSHGWGRRRPQTPYLPLQEKKRPQTPLAHLWERGRGEGRKHSPTQNPCAPTRPKPKRDCGITCARIASWA